MSCQVLHQQHGPRCPCHRGLSICNGKSQPQHIRDSNTPGLSYEHEICLPPFRIHSTQSLPTSRFSLRCTSREQYASSAKEGSVLIKLNNFPGQGLMNWFHCKMNLIPMINSTLLCLCSVRYLQLC